MEISRSRSKSHCNGNGNGNHHSKIFEEIDKFADLHISDSLYINHAEIAWNETRRAWVGNNQKKQQRPPKDPIVSWTTTYDELLSTTEPFQDPIPLAEMVDFLVDTWLEEGLFD